MRRAILWCGHVRRPTFARDAEGRRREVGDTLLAADDFRIQVNGLELAFRAAEVLGVPENEVYACLVRPDLAPQSLRTDVFEATVAGLRRLASRIGPRSKPDDALLFVTVNHGSRDGCLVTADPMDEFAADDAPPPPRLTPAVLDECLRPIAGPQVIIVATCFSGAFLPLANDPRRAVLAACPANEEYTVTRAEGTCAAFLDELFGAWCGVAHSDDVPTARLALNDAFEQAKKRLAGIVPLNVPLWAGANVWPG